MSFFTEVIGACFPNLNSENFFLHEGDGKTCDLSFKQTMAASKILKIQPEEILQTLKNKIDSSYEDFTCNISNGNLNIRYKDEYLISEINRDILDIPNQNNNRNKTILIDFSSPNICKEMHVGHLRSTIIGESLCRIYEEIGYNVLRINHIGDWGTQFGMLINFLKKNNIDWASCTITDLTNFYKEAKKLSDADVNFKNDAKKETYKLQRGDIENRKMWQKLCETTLKEFQKMYDMLNVKSLVRGESFYQEYMDEMIASLENEERLVEHDGNRVIFSNGKYLILVKADGGYTYDTSDLAALKYRFNVENVDEIVYVVDLGQESHFLSLFEIGRNLDYIREFQIPHYVGFGVVLGKDGKRLKTRSGETIKLTGLLQDAFENAYKVSKENNKKDVSEEELKDMAKKISLNCIKYSDLSNPRTSSYKYDPARMMNSKGNTAVYLMYAMARCKSILKKTTEHLGVPIEERIIENIENAETRNLIFEIIKYPSVLNKSAKQFSPHYLCNYLYNLVNKLSLYYEKNRCIEYENGQIMGVNLERISLIKKSVTLIEKLFRLVGLEEIEYI